MSDAPFELQYGRRAYRVLVALEAEGPLTRVELVDRLAKPNEHRRRARSGVWNAIHHLRDSGMVERPGPGFPFELTPHGFLVLDDVRSRGPHPNHKDAA